MARRSGPRSAYKCLISDVQSPPLDAPPREPDPSRDFPPEAADYIFKHLASHLGPKLSLVDLARLMEASPSLGLPALQFLASGLELLDGSDRSLVPRAPENAEFERRRRLHSRRALFALRRADGRGTLDRPALGRLMPVIVSGREDLGLIEALGGFVEREAIGGLGVRWSLQVPLAEVLVGLSGAGAIGALDFDDRKSTMDRVLGQGPEDLAHLTALTRLSAVSFVWDASFSPAVVAGLSSLQLTRLDIRGETDPARELDVLCAAAVALPTLNHIDVCGDFLIKRAGLVVSSILSPMQAAALAGFSSLEYLSCTSCSLKPLLKAAKAQGISFPALDEICLNHYEKMDFSSFCHESLPALRSLPLSVTPSDLSQVQCKTHLTNLTLLSVNPVEAMEPFLPCLSELTALEALTLDSRPRTDAAAPTASMFPWVLHTGLKRLTYLSFRLSDVQDGQSPPPAVFESIATVASSLKSLNIWAVNSGPGASPTFSPESRAAFFQALARMRRLKDLAVFSAPAPPELPPGDQIDQGWDREWEFLTGLMRLKRLELLACNKEPVLSPELATALVRRSPGLRILSNSIVGFGDRGPSLEEMPEGVRID